MVRDLMIGAVSQLSVELGSSECGGDSYCSGTLVVPNLSTSHDPATAEIGSELEELLRSA